MNALQKNRKEVRTMKKVIDLLLAGSFVLALVLAIFGCGKRSPGASTSPLALASIGQDGNIQDPSYVCAITVPDPEPADLSSLAKITADSAKAVALQANPGTTATKVELDNENGCLVYSVKLSNGSDVKVDAGNGAILHVEPAGADDEQEHHEGMEHEGAESGD
jgi:hypothetical protein